MASFSYTRSFAHVPWRNHEDVVDAEGDNGFNRRFQDLESEFDDVASTIGDIAAEVDTISGGLPLAQIVGGGILALLIVVFSQVPVGQEGLDTVTYGGKDTRLETPDEIRARYERISGGLEGE